MQISMLIWEIAKHFPGSIKSIYSVDIQSFYISDNYIVIRIEFGN